MDLVRLPITFCRNQCSDGWKADLDSPRMRVKRKDSAIRNTVLRT